MVLLAVVALGLAGVTAVAPSALLLSLLGLAVALGVLLLPRLTVPVLLIALALQGVVARNLEASSPELAGVVRSIDEITLLGALIRVVALLVGGVRDWFKMRDWGWALGFVVIGSASSLVHWTGARPALVGLALACKFFGFLGLALSVPWEERDGERLIRAVAWMAPILLVIGAVGYAFPEFTTQYFAAKEGDTEYTRGGVTPFMVPFVNPGLYGWAMAVCTLAWFALLSERRSAAGVLGMTSSALAAVMSLRRRPLLGIPIAIVGGIVHLRRRQRAIAIIVAALLLGGAGWFGAGLIRITIVDTLQNYLDPLARERTARGAVTAVSLVLAGRSFPLGEGFGRYGGYAAQRYYSSLYDEFGLSRIWGLSPETPYYLQDTYWPHVLGEVGVLGALAMLGALAYYWRKSGTIYRDRSLPGPVRLVALFGSLILLEGFVESAGGPVFEFPLQALMIALPIGMALRMSRSARVQRAAGSVTGPNAPRPT